MKTNSGCLMAAALALLQMPSPASAKIDDAFSRVKCSNEYDTEVANVGKVALLGAIASSGKRGSTSGFATVSGYAGIKKNGAFWSGVDVGGKFKFDAWASQATAELYICTATWNAGDNVMCGSFAN